VKRTNLPALGIAGLAIAWILCSPSPGEAQERDQARTVAARVQTFYDQTDTYQASFYQTYFSRMYGRYSRSRGRLTFDKPGRMRFDYARPNGKVIVSDGQKLTMWEPGDDGGPGQYLEQAMRDNALPAAFSFLTGQGRLEDDYRFRLLNARAWRWNGHVLELRPRRADPRTRRILLFVDADPARAGIVHRIRIDDHEGNRNKFSLTHMRFNPAVQSGLFAFRPPAGARRM